LRGRARTEIRLCRPYGVERAVSGLAARHPVEVGSLEVGDRHDVALAQVPADEKFLLLCLLRIGRVTGVTAGEGVAGVALRPEAVVEAQVADDPGHNRDRRRLEHGRDRHRRLTLLAAGAK